MFRLFPSSTNSYAAGKEVFNSYGRRSNFQLLLDYGFALSENEWDYVDIALPKDAVSKRFPFLRRLQLDRRSSLEDLFPVSALATTTSPPTSPSESKAENAERVLALQTAYAWLRGVAVTALETFGTTFIEDAEQQSTRQDVSERRRAALIYRVSRMKIVQHVIHQIDSALLRISVPEEEVVNGSAVDSVISDELRNLELDGAAQSSST